MDENKIIASHLVNSSIDVNKRSKFRKSQKEIREELEQRLPIKKRSRGRPKKDFKDETVQITAPKRGTPRKQKDEAIDSENQEIFTKVDKVIGLQNCSPAQRENFLRLAYDKHMIHNHIESDSKQLFYAKQIEELETEKPVMYSDYISGDFEEFRKRRKETGIDLSLDLFGKEVDKWPMV